MRWQVFILTLITFRGCLVEEQCGELFMDKTGVAEGNTSWNEWRWVVAFWYWPEDESFCGGSLISSKHVLTGEWA
jgi:hypothetical protein